MVQSTFFPNVENSWHVYLSIGLTIWYVPEEPVNSTPDVSYFLLFFWASRPGYYVQRGHFFLKIFGVHFYTIKTGTLTPEFDFLNIFPIFSSKKHILDPKIFKKTTIMLHKGSRAGGPEKKTKSKKRPGYYLRGLPVFKFR